MKLLALLLSVCLVFPCLPSFAEEDITGTWTAEYYIMDGSTVIPYSFMGYSIELKKDGSFIYTDSKERTGTWVYSNNDYTVSLIDGTSGEEISILHYAESISLSSNDGKNNEIENPMIEEDSIGGMTVYVRTDKPVNKPDTIQASSIDFFVGNWVATHILISQESGTWMPLEQFWEIQGKHFPTSSVTIDSEHINLLLSGDDANFNFDGIVRFENGRIIASDLKDEDFLIEANATEDDMMLITFIQDNESILQLYYTREEDL